MATHTQPGRTLNGGILSGMYIVSVLLCLAGNLVIRLGARGGWLVPGGQVALGVVAALPLAVATLMFWRLLTRELDEMLSKIVVHGMAIAMTLYLPVLAVYVNLKTAGVWLPRLDPPDLLLAPAIFIAIGIAIARRRYL